MSSNFFLASFQSYWVRPKVSLFIVVPGCIFLTFSTIPDKSETTFDVFSETLCLSVLRPHYNNYPFWYPILHNQLGSIQTYNHLDFYSYKAIILTPNHSEPASPSVKHPSCSLNTNCRHHVLFVSQVEPFSNLVRYLFYSFLLIVREGFISLFL